MTERCIWHDFSKSIPYYLMPFEDVTCRWQICDINISKGWQDLEEHYFDLVCYNIGGFSIPRHTHIEFCVCVARVGFGPWWRNTKLLLMWVCYVHVHMYATACGEIISRRDCMHIVCSVCGIDCTMYLNAYRSFSVMHGLRNVYVHVWDLITNNSLENQLAMIFLNHQCYCHLGIPRIVSAKYEVILRLATTCMFFVREVFIEKKELKEKKRFSRYGTKTYNSGMIGLSSIKELAITLGAATLCFLIGLWKLLYNSCICTFWGTYMYTCKFSWGCVQSCPKVYIHLSRIQLPSIYSSFLFHNHYYFHSYNNFNNSPIILSKLSATSLLLMILFKI